MLLSFLLANYLTQQLYTISKQSTSTCIVSYVLDKKK